MLIGLPSQRRKGARRGGRGGQKKNETSKSKKRKENKSEQGVPAAITPDPPAVGMPRFFAAYIQIFLQIILIHNVLHLKMYVVFPLPVFLSPVLQAGPWLITS